MKMNRKGFTLFEAIVASMLMAIMLLTIAELISHTIRYFRSTSVRQQLQSDGDSTINAITRALQLAQKSSIVICSCGNTKCTATCNTTAPSGTPPNSRIEYSVAGSTATIYQLNDSVQMAVGTRSPQALAAHNVQGLMFTGDAQDLSRIYISLTMSAAVSPTQTVTFTIPNQAVRLTQ